jgi:hypothetical protein
MVAGVEAAPMERYNRARMELVEAEAAEHLEHTPRA